MEWNKASYNNIGMDYTMCYYFIDVGKGASVITITRILEF